MEVIVSSFLPPPNQADHSVSEVSV